MSTNFYLLLRAMLLSLLACAGAAHAQAESKTCVVVFLHGKAASPQALAALARRVQATCAARSLEMPWSSRRAEKDSPAAATQEIAAQIKGLRQQGFKRVVLVGHGVGANAALAYAAGKGDADGLIAVSSDGAANAGGFGSLPELASRMPQYMPVFWVVGRSDPAREQTEDFAFVKAPPHPASRFLLAKSDTIAAPEAVAAPVLEWIKSSE